jgi:ComF family protein
MLEALFPSTKSEKELFSLSPEQALEILPRAPETPFTNMRSTFAYKDDRVTRLIWNIKYKKSKRATEIGGYALYSKLIEITRSDLVKENTRIIIPIPITKRRKNERGYNQCELLADEIARLDTEKRFVIEKELLRRIHHADRQTLKDRTDRLTDAKGIFSVDDIFADKIKNDTNQNKIPIIVIDDVITTGSTMKEAIDTLQKSGFERILGISLAH